MTEAEALAFAAGQNAALETVHIALARAWGANGPPGRSGPDGRPYSQKRSGT
ncbi:hypothetical protein [Frankia sp. CiP1_Cm_nod1]|uniref:hypothetical protein n=1 Tax=Frankia sp. CiP1_Cm_nod1 TaxID=2897160 RepID=UPI00202402A6